MTGENARCAATTKSGERCKNRAQAGSAYCYIHRSLAHAAGPPSVEAPPPAAADPTVASAVHTPPTTMDAQLVLFVQELKALVKELQRRVPERIPPAVTPAQVLELFNSNIGRYAPGPQRELLLDLQRNLEEATFRDLVDPETLKGLWYILQYSVQAQSSAARDSVLGRIASLPGFALLADLRGNLEGTKPQDLVDPATWKGLWTVLSYAAQQQVHTARRRLRGDAGDDE